MLLIVLIGSVAIVLPAIFAVNRLQNHIMERLLGMPPQVLSVRCVSCGMRSAALILALLAATIGAVGSVDRVRQAAEA